jgi:hypothetical protein
VLASRAPGRTPSIERENQLGIMAQMKVALPKEIYPDLGRTLNHMLLWLSM